MWTVINSISQFEFAENPHDSAMETYRLRPQRGASQQIHQLRSALLEKTHALLDGIKFDFKWIASVKMLFVKAANPSVITRPPIFFESEPFTSTSGDALGLQLQVALNQLTHDIDGFERNGSGWVIHHILEIDIRVMMYDPLRAGAHVAVSQSLARLRCLLNIKNTGSDWYVSFSQ